MRAGEVGARAEEGRADGARDRPGVRCLAGSGCVSAREEEIRQPARTARGAAERHPHPSAAPGAPRDAGEAVAAAVTGVRAR